MRINAYIILLILGIKFEIRGSLQYTKSRSESFDFVFIRIYPFEIFFALFV